jgi:hypothetical protein
MGAEPNFGELLRELKACRTTIERRDDQTARRLGDVESSLDEIFVRLKRPGSDGGYSLGEVGERKEVAEWVAAKHALDVPKDDGNAAAYEPSRAEIDDALLARQVLRKLWRHGEVGRLVVEGTFYARARDHLVAHQTGNVGAVLQA